MFAGQNKCSYENLIFSGFDCKVVLIKEEDSEDNCSF